jgi:serine/threonine protein kinase
VNVCFLDVFGPKLRIRRTGASGIVYAGRWKSKNNMPVAVKAIALISAPPKGINIDEIQSLLAPTISEFVIEIKIMASLAHPNLMPLLGVIAQSSAECRLVTEYMPRGSLSSLLPHLDRKYLFPMTKSIAMGMHYLLSRSTPILHRDLKLENVLVADDYTIKISDFGLSKVASPTMTQQAVGTPHYMAPECIEHGLFSEKSGSCDF